MKVVVTNQKSCDSEENVMDISPVIKALKDREADLKEQITDCSLDIWSTYRLYNVCKEFVDSEEKKRALSSSLAEVQCALERLCGEGENEE